MTPAEKGRRRPGGAGQAPAEALGLHQPSGVRSHTNSPQTLSLGSHLLSKQLVVLGILIKYYFGSVSTSSIFLSFFFFLKMAKNTTF